MDEDIGTFIGLCIVAICAFGAVLGGWVVVYIVVTNLIRFLG